ncbi:hypothetical protein [Herbidospora sp. NBRC 101105]|uniref:hypothetical protein n=1 Tax=Herbidospora sp. NBRC 101105 TaxID=3032195 RepID=UPI0024A1C1D8|nr:hypothetical protein [Herbidospora sp. NBRC 101105]GLX92936.1 hypothetical protein Hesp01_08860 [Herbidospora sp. NBRC 101105]
MNKKKDKGLTRSLFYLTASVLLVGVGRIIADYYTDGPERITGGYLVTQAGVFGGGWLLLLLIALWVHFKTNNLDDDDEND